MTAIACTFLSARRRHLPALHGGDAPVGEEDRDIGARAPAEGLDRGPAGIARRGADDGRPLAALGEDMVHQPGEELHRQVLEGERRPVEELKQEMVRADLDERRHRVVAKRRVGFLDHALQRRRGDLAAGEAVDDPQRRFGIGEAGKCRDLALGERRPGLRKVEPAVARQPREHDVAKTERRCFAAGRDITHAEDTPSLEASNL